MKWRKIQEYLHEYIKMQNTKNQEVTTQTKNRNKNEQHRTSE